MLSAALSLVGIMCSSSIDGAVCYKLVFLPCILQKNLKFQISNILIKFLQCRVVVTKEALGVCAGDLPGSLSGIAAAVSRTHNDLLIANAAS